MRGVTTRPSFGCTLPVSTSSLWFGDTLHWNPLIILAHPHRRVQTSTRSFRRNTSRTRSVSPSLPSRIPADPPSSPNSSTSRPSSPSLDGERSSSRYLARLGTISGTVPARPIFPACIRMTMRISPISPRLIKRSSRCSMRPGFATCKSMIPISLVSLASRQDSGLGRQACAIQLTTCTRPCTDFCSEDMLKGWAEDDSNTLTSDEQFDRYLEFYNECFKASLPLLTLPRYRCCLPCPTVLCVSTAPG